MTGLKLILATGYVGGHLVPILLEAGYRVRCLVRDPARLQGYSWVGRVEVFTGDLTDTIHLTDCMDEQQIPAHRRAKRC